MISKFFSFESPAKSAIFSFLAVIMVGAFFLLLPGAQRVPVPFFDVLFTAFSATTVTGMMSVPLDSFTLFGRAVILILMQIGGLGLVTLTLFLASFFVSSGVKTHVMAGYLFELTHFKSITALIRFIIGLTLVAELCGFLFFIGCFFYWNVENPVFAALFHSVSSFCNVGFPPISGHFYDFTGHIPFMIVTGFLIFLGSFGFLAWYEIFQWLRGEAPRVRPFSLTTCLVLVATVLTIFSVSLLLFLLQLDIMKGFVEHLCASIFTAVSWRSCGLSAFPMKALHPASLFIMLITSLLGSGPGSTGSGLRVLPVALCGAAIRSVFAGRTVVEVQGKQIPNEQVFKALTLVMLSFTAVAVTIFLLLLIEQHMNVMDLVCEAFAAYTNSGLSRGITPALSIPAKIVVMAAMFLGRIGSLTFIFAFRSRARQTQFSYPEERVILT